MPFQLGLLDWLKLNYHGEKQCLMFIVKDCVIYFKFNMASCFHLEITQFVNF